MIISQILIPQFTSIVLSGRREKEKKELGRENDTALSCANKWFMMFMNFNSNVVRHCRINIGIGIIQRLIYD
jgi:hypothetical protein